MRRQKMARLVSRVRVSASSLSMIRSRRISERLTIVATPRTARTAAIPSRNAVTTGMDQKKVAQAKTEVPKRTAKIQIRVNLRLVPQPLYARRTGGRSTQRGRAN